MILSTLMMKAISSCETSDLTGTTLRHIPEAGILLNTKQLNAEH
jgi:hypothetical protein